VYGVVREDWIGGYKFLFRELEIKETDIQNQNVQDPIDMEGWMSDLRKEIGEKFPEFEILDIDDSETKKKIKKLEQKSYKEKGYATNTEQDQYFERIKNYNGNNFLQIGIFNEDSSELEYYMDAYFLSPNELVFPDQEEFYNIENKDRYTNLPGLVFNKILKNPDFKNSTPRGGQLQLFLIKKLLEKTQGEIRIEEQCQPASYKFFKIASRTKYLKILKDIEIENNSGTDVHQILVVIDNNPRTIKFLNNRTP
jgi:hypothetical protein